MITNHLYDCSPEENGGPCIAWYSGLEAEECGAPREQHQYDAHEPPAYLDRLKYEVDLILHKGFGDYFLVIADLLPGRVT